jgi:hypothetical protein
MSKANCGGDNEIAGGATMHVSAGSLSSIILACSIDIVSPGIAFDAATVIVNTKSVLHAETAVFSGHGILGKKYLVYDGTLQCPSGHNPAREPIPGVGFEIGDGAILRGCQ